MIGNLWGWCQDWYGAYPAGSVTDPQGAVTGSWYAYAWECRSAYRDSADPGLRGSFHTLGFRVLLAPGQ